MKNRQHTVNKNTQQSIRNSQEQRDNLSDSMDLQLMPSLVGSDSEANQEKRIVGIVMKLEASTSLFLKHKEDYFDNA